MAAINQALLSKIPFTLNGKITLREWEEGPVQEEKKFLFTAYDSCCSLYSIDSTVSLVRGKHFMATFIHDERHVFFNKNISTGAFQDLLDTAMLKKQFGAAAKDIKVLSDKNGNRMICSNVYAGNEINNILIQYRVPSYSPSVVKMVLAGTSVPTNNDSIFRAPVMETIYQLPQPMVAEQQGTMLLQNKMIDTLSILRLAGAEGYRIVKQ